MTSRQTIRGRVGWAETDASGAFYFTHAFRWAEVAETALWRRLGRLDVYARTPRRLVEAELLRPLRFDDEYQVTLWPERLGETSITWSFEITCADISHVRGRVVVVHVDETGKSAPLPDDVRALLDEGEHEHSRKATS
jgi:YbgC/YbaW family acyl-CoA thioester hydrolase